MIDEICFFSRLHLPQPQWHISTQMQDRLPTLPDNLVTQPDNLVTQPDNLATQLDNPVTQLHNLHTLQVNPDIRQLNLAILPNLVTLATLHLATLSLRNSKQKNKTTNVDYIMWY